jgi:gliding motility-associated-like protein
MKQAYLIFLFWIVSLPAIIAQNPGFTISPSGATSVCAGSTINLSSNVSNAFAGTTSYGISDIPFAPYPMPVGTNVTMPDDTVLGPYAIGFQFCFFGNAYTQFYIGSNGWIGFSPGMTRAFTANTIPSNNMFVPRNCIMGPWMDFNPGVAGGPYIKFQTQGVAPYRRLVVQWLNVPFYQCTALKSTFQIVIYESTNVIENHITSKPTCMAWAGGNATQGLHNLAGTQAFAVPGRNASVWTANNEAKRYSPNGPGSYTVNWTSNGAPIGTGSTTTATINGPGLTRLIGRIAFQCSNLVLYDTLDVSIGGAASANFSVPSPVCAGQAANFSYTGGAAGAGVWTFGSGTPSTANTLASASSTWNTPGTYPVTLTVTPSAAGCSPGTLTQNVVITAPPTSTFTAPATACIGTSSTITYTGSAATGATYLWDFGSGATPATASTAGPHAVSWSTAGTKTLSLTVTSGACSSTTTTTVTVNAAPVASFSVNPNPICAQSNATVSFTGSAAAGATYNWTFGMGAVPMTANGVGPHTVSYGSAGTKTIGLTVNAGGCSASTSQNISVSAPPTATFTLPTSVCVGEMAAITYTGNAGATSTYTWSVDGATQSPGNTSGPLSLSWASAGTKTIGLSITQGACTVSSSNSITVNPIPTVLISASPSTICAGQSTTLSVSGAAPAAGSTYAWNFGSGASPATSNSSSSVSVTYPTAGSIQPSLTVTSNGCTSAAATTTVNVNAAPSVTISSPTNACSGSTVNVSAVGALPAGTTYTWDFGTAIVLSGSGAGPYTVQWAAAGNQPIGLLINTGVCTANASASITINPIPTASFSLPTSICVNENTSVSFAGSASAVASYSWNFGAGATPATANTVGPHAVSWSTGGNKNVTLTVSQGGCTSTLVTQQINVNTQPVASFSLASNACAGDGVSLIYTGTSGASANYTWSYPGADYVSGSGASVEIAYAAGGNYSVSLEVDENGCGSAIVSNAIGIQEPLLFTLSSDAAALVNSAVTISYTGTQLPGAVYIWDFSGGTVLSGSGAGPYQVSWATPGLMTISCTVSGLICGNVTESVQTEVIDTPVISFAMPANACAGEQIGVSFTGTLLPGAVVSWNFDGATILSGSGVGPYTLSWNLPGSHTVSVTVQQMGITTTESNTIEVFTVPTANFNVPAAVCVGESAAVNFTGTMNPATTLSWNFDGGVNAGADAANNNVSFGNTGNYSISLQVSENGCTSAVNTEAIEVRALPAGAISADAFACAGETISIEWIGVASSSATYSWDFDGATILSGSAEGPFELQWNNAANAIVSVDVNDLGCSASFSMPIEIRSMPLASFSVANDGCTGQDVEVEFTGTSASTAIPTWDFTGATIESGSGFGPYTLNYASTGNYAIELSINQNGCISVYNQAGVVQDETPFASLLLPDTAYAGLAVDVEFTGTAAPASSFEWTYTGASLNSGSGNGPMEMQWNTPGTYAVELTVSNGTCSDNVTEQIVIVPFPGPSFAFDNDTACVATPVVLTFNGTAVSNATYYWDFDGASVQSGSGAGPYQVVWNTAGVPTASLYMLVDGVQTPVFENEILILDIPQASFNLPETVCAGEQITVNYTGTTGINAQFQWDFDGATLVSGASTGSVSVVWDTAGTHSVSLSIADAMCISVPALDAIDVLAAPVLAFDLDSIACLYAETEVVFTGTASSSASFTWDFDGAEIVSGSASGPYTLRWNTAGIHSVAVEAIDNGCAAMPTSMSIEVRSLPIADAGTDQTVCSGDSAILQAVAVVGNAYSWTPNTEMMNPDSSSTSVAAQNTSTSPVSQVFTLEVSDGFCTATDQVSVVVNPAPVAQFIVPQGQCFDVHSFDFTPSGTYSETALFAWNLGPHALAHVPGDRQQLGIRFAEAGVQVIQLIVSDQGCSSSAYVDSVEVFANPLASFAAEQTGGCYPFNASFVAEDSLGIHTDFKWVFGDGGTGSGISPSHLYTESGFMTVTLTVTDIHGCIGSQTQTDYIQVYERPIAGFRVNPSTDYIIGEDELSLSNLSQDARFSYYIIDGDTILGATSTYDFTEPGTYEITQVVINAEGCTDEMTKSVKASFGSEYYIPLAFTPDNDGKNDLFKVMGEEIKSYSIEIFDRWGAPIFASSNMEEGWDGIISNSQVPAPVGVYVFKLEMRDYKNRPIQKSGSITLLR